MPLSKTRWLTLLFNCAPLQHYGTPATPAGVAGAYGAPAQGGYGAQYGMQYPPAAAAAPWVGNTPRARPSAWTALKDPKTGVTYYFNSATKVSTWTCPPELASAGNAAAPASRGYYPSPQQQPYFPHHPQYHPQYHPHPQHRGHPAANPNPSRTGPADPGQEARMQSDQRSICIKAVEHAATLAELEAHFAGCGEIKRVFIKNDKLTGRSMGYGYVEFADKDSVELAMALDDSLLSGHW